MTLPSEVIPEPAAVEDEGVAEYSRLARNLKAIGGKRLLLARLDWERLFTSSNPPGAATPSVARATLTIDAQRRWKLARQARRGVTPAYRLAKAIIER